jgi:hypothetical protein
MIDSKTWSFDEGPIRSITAELGRIVVTNEDSQLTITRKGEGYLLGFALMAQGRRDEVGALLGAYAIAWPEPIMPPGSLVVGMNIEIDEDGR